MSATHNSVFKNFAFCKSSYSIPVDQIPGLEQIALRLNALGPPSGDSVGAFLNAPW